MSQIERAARWAATGKRADRLSRIVELVSTRGEVRGAELADELNVSSATLRRDLADLEEQGLLARSHGGARSLDPTTEISVLLRDAQSRDAKARIADYAAGLLPESRHGVAMNGGTTTAAVARALARRGDLTIITNSLTTATALASSSTVKVIMTGGHVRSSSLEAVGALAERTFAAINVGTAFLGIDGISVRGGATTHDETEARTNTVMLERAERVVVVADGSKIGRTMLAKMADLHHVHDLVTDATADADDLAGIRAAGVQVHVVED